MILQTIFIPWCISFQAYLSIIMWLSILWRPIKLFISVCIWYGSSFPYIYWLSQTNMIFLYILRETIGVDADGAVVIASCTRDDALPKASHWLIAFHSSCSPPIRPWTTVIPFSSFLTHSNLYTWTIVCRTIYLLLLTNTPLMYSEVC